MKNKFSAFITIAIVFIASCNGNPGKADNPQQSAVPVDKESNDFLVNALHNGMAEARLAKLAKEKTISRKVKDYAGMIMNDHGILNDQLKAVSSGLHIVLPSSPDKGMQTKLRSLNDHAGKDFDRIFLDIMIGDHEKVIRLFEHASKKVNNAEVKTLIDNALPQLNKHLDSARALIRMYK
ncbi:DUF4142 domain-containing protein [Agriterribacter sp.]|uniref:DUF4142 domain-containing protein n=1 Tax=Agriterribacter sp. TaxID=2821509 RepID=UPI002C9B01D2|nr:DUF4142 domain-containing protein [Agriterribacter sp.]HRP56588.1 DUF4142 domain-containing protein [Agriterribacter sp.]